MKYIIKSVTSFDTLLTDAKNELGETVYSSSSKEFFPQNFHTAIQTIPADGSEFEVSYDDYTTMSRWYYTIKSSCNCNNGKKQNLFLLISTLPE